VRLYVADNEGSMLGRAPLAILVVLGLIASSTAGAVFVYYNSVPRVTAVVTDTITLTSVNTVVQIITRTPVQNVPSTTIILNGTVESEKNYPVAVDFCSYTTQNFFRGNGSVEEAPVSGISCGSYSSPVHITNQTLERIGSDNITFFLGTYSAKLPNNATYLLQVRLQSSAGPGFEEEAGWLPLNYTSSHQISGYGVSCYEVYENGSQSFQCNSGFS
jgi:hypothetical protein